MRTQAWALEDVVKKKKITKTVTTTKNPDLDREQGRCTDPHLKQVSYCSLSLVWPRSPGWPQAGFPPQPPQCWYSKYTPSSLLVRQVSEHKS